MKGWRPALRLAWRDAWKSKGRSILVLFMIALPVLAVTAASVVQATADVSSLEGVERTMGSAQARVQATGGSAVLQAPDPGSGMWTQTGSGEASTPAELAEALGGRDFITIADGHADIPLGDRRVTALATEVELNSPLAEGLFDLRVGELPARPGEAVVNDSFAERGVAIGDALEVLGHDVTVVGIGRDAEHRKDLTVISPPGSFGDKFTGDRVAPDWLVGGDPVLWSDVLALNKLGALVHSRAVLADPPPVVEMAERMGYDTGRGLYITVAALVITMALLEVVLLAGPAFAVGARRQARNLALMAASGGTPRQARRVVLASGIVLGGLAALIGAVLGVPLGLVLLPVVQRFSNAWFGPVDVNWLVVSIVAAFGLLSALLAAVVPAWLASRQDVVAVLSGRRGDPPPSPRTPVLGVLLLGAGIGLCVAGVRRGHLFNFYEAGQYAIAFGAVVSVFGMIFIVPLVVTLLARLSGSLPLVMRYAARDAARHRTRTVPAIAAVAATVAGVVALGIANTSDEKQNRETYTRSLPMDTGLINIYPTESMDGSASVPPSQQTWDRAQAIVRAQAPEIDTELVEGLRFASNANAFIHVSLSVPSAEMLLSGWGGTLGSDLLVGEVVPGFLEVDDEGGARAALQAGKAVVLTDHPVNLDEVTVTMERWDGEGDETASTSSLTWPAHFVETDAEMPPTQAIIPAALAAELDRPVETVALYLGGEISKDQEQAIREEVTGLDANAYLIVERGYETPDEIFILLLVLFTLGGVLMLGGTLTATFLALSDARPDLATLSAVGAAPRSRRGVAASYTLVVGFVGGVLGALVGFIPGVAITYPLTGSAGQSCSSGADGMLVCESAGPFLDIPWLLIVGLVVALPLLTAAIVGLTARSRLPLVTRLT